jgi:triphosphoribosyl-dephospho-CoA synthase
LTKPATSAAVARAFHDACLAELEALKPGNVHRFGDGHRMSVADFEKSACAAATPLAQSGLTVGRRIGRAVAATVAAVGQNTNLGIILLAAPLAEAALGAGPGDLRQRLAERLRGLGVEDAREAYGAIRLAKPGGLGEAPRHNVAAVPEVTLLEAMREAEARDRIAWNYTHDFADIFDFGLARLAGALERWQSLASATSFVYLGFLATIPDTLIARKFGAGQAAAVRQEAQSLEARFAECASPQAVEPELMEFDRSLKAAGLNPGTSADLTVATLFAASLKALT